MTFAGTVFFYELIQVVAFQRVGFLREMLVGSEVVDPERFGPGVFLGGFRVQEQDVGFDASRVEDAGGESQQGVDVAGFQQVATDGFSGTSFEQDVVRDHDGTATVHFKQRFDVLDKVELLVLGGRPEVLPFIR